MNRLVAVVTIVVATTVGAFAAPSGLPSGFFTGPQITRPALTLRAFTAGVTPGFPATAVAWDLARGANGTMWFSDGQTPGIGTISCAGKVHEYTALPLGAKPYSIIADSDGDAWFTDYGTASVGRVSPNGTIVEFTDARLANTYPSAITMTPDGAVWFISIGMKPVLGRLTARGLVTYALPPDLSPDGSLIADMHGDLWFLSNTQKAIVVQRKANGTLVRHPTPLSPVFEPCCPNLAPKRMVIGPDGNVWLTTLDYGYGTSSASFIATFRRGIAMLFKVENGPIQYAVYPSGITTAGDTLWFSGDDPFQLNGGLWHMDTAGAMTAYPIAYNPVALTTQTDHRLWFTSFFGGHPSQIVEATLK